MSASLKAVKSIWESQTFSFSKTASTTNVAATVMAAGIALEMRLAEYAMLMAHRLQNVLNVSCRQKRERLVLHAWCLALNSSEPENRLRCEEGVCSISVTATVTEAGTALQNAQETSVNVRTIPFFVQRPAKVVKLLPTSSRVARRFCSPMAVSSTPVFVTAGGDGLVTIPVSETYAKTGLLQKVSEMLTAIAGIHQRHQSPR